MALKVFRTPIGFHDAYVAAPSRKAALAAWGADKDLFARGVAEVVTDPALTAEPLTHPGTVVKRLRGTAAEQIDAAGVAAPAKQAARVKPGPPKARAPRPDRDAVDAAEAALAQAEEGHRAAEAALAAEEQALAERRRALRADWSATRETLEAARDAAADAYDAALAAWQAG